MMTSRLETFRAMLAKSPESPLVRFGLANELVKSGLHGEAAEQLRAYLSSYDDEGNGYGRLAEALIVMGQIDDAKVALRGGIEAANRFGHPGMANELSARLDELEET